MILRHLTNRRPRTWHGDVAEMLHDTFREFCRMEAIIFTIVYRLDAWLWEIAGNFLKDHDYSQENELIHSLAYLALHFLSLESVEFTIALCKHFFPKTTIIGYIQPARRNEYCWDQLKKASLCSLIRTIKYVIFILALQTGGPYVVFYIWAWYMGVTVFKEMKKIWSIWRSEPMRLSEHGNSSEPELVLRQEIQNLADAAGFPLRDIYLVHCRTDINVYVCNWSKCIFLLDTFVEKLIGGDRIIRAGEFAIVVAIAHELGRLRSNHKIYSFIAYQVYMLLQSGLFVLISSLGGLYVTLGFKTQPSVIEIVMYYRVLNAFRSLVGPLYNLFNRSFVYKADAYAMKLCGIESFMEYILRLKRKSLFPRPIYPPSALHNPVPTPNERVFEINRI